MKVKIVNKSKNKLPQYSTGISAGMDLRANLENPIVLKPLERTIVKTGIYIQLPTGYESFRSDQEVALCCLKKE